VVGQVGGDGVDGGTRVLLREPPQRLLPTPDDVHLVAAGGEPLGDGPPDPGPATGHHDDPRHVTSTLAATTPHAHGRTSLGEPRGAVAHPALPRPPRTRTGPRRSSADRAGSRRQDARRTTL